MAFYQHYAQDNELTLSQVATRVSKWDQAQLAQALSELDMTGWPEDAISRVRGFGANAGINKVHVIGAIVGIGVVMAAVKNHRIAQAKFNTDKQAELKRMKSAFNLASKEVKRVSSMITDPAVVSQWSAEIWTDTDDLANDVQNLVNKHVRHGVSLEELQDSLANHTNKNHINPNKSIADRLKQSRTETKRIIRTESARLVNQTDLATFRVKGAKLIDVVGEPNACEKYCQPIINNGPYLIDEVPGVPEDTHPNCRCIYMIHGDGFSTLEI